MHKLVGNRLSAEERLSKQSVWKAVLYLAIPSMLSQFVNVAYGIVDRIYIGNMAEVGQIALAGVGICGPITTVVSSFAYLIGLGGAPLMAIKLGEGDKTSAQKILSTSFYLLLIVAVLLTAIVAIFGDVFLVWFGAGKSSMPYAQEYLHYYNIGTLFAIMAAGLNSFIIAQGRAKTGMLTGLIGAITNIALDPLFIFVFGMGVGGAAIATVISQAASAIFAFVMLTFVKSSSVVLRFKTFSRAMASRTVLLGLSAFLIIATDSVMLLALNSALQTYGGDKGDMLISAATIMLSFMQVITLPLGGITSGTQPILSYNYGKGDIDRVRVSQFAILMLSLGFCIVMFILAQFFAGGFVSIFTTDKQLQQYAIQFISVYTLGVIPLAFQYAYVDGLTALGIAPLAITLSLLRKLGIMLPLTLLLPIWYGVDSVIFAEPIADIASAIASCVVYLCLIGKILRRRQLRIEHSNALLQQHKD